MLDGRMLLRVGYRDRRKLLETLASGGGLVVPDLLPRRGALEEARRRGLEGVVAKKWDSTYQPGRSSAWIKDKFWNTQEVVIGGWRAGEGGRSSGIGALLVGVPGGGGLQFVGRVGTGFTDKMLDDLRATLKPLETSESPFNAALSTLDGKGVTFVRPELVGEVRYSERTTDHRLRQPSWRGLRPDKSPGEIVWE
jgi:ATP-dependent DNA ligase